MSGWELVSAASATTTSAKTTSVSCSGNKKVVGGGYAITASGNETQVTVTASYPSANNTWTVITVKNQANPTWSVSVYAICATA